MSHRIRNLFVLLIGVLVLLGGLANTSAKTSNFLSAEESDPNQLGWMTGLLAEILVAEGQLDENAQVTSIVPELASSAFGSATVRQVMDMTTALDYSEDYADPEADIWICPKVAKTGAIQSQGWL